VFLPERGTDSVTVTGLDLNHYPCHAPIRRSTDLWWSDVIPSRILYLREAVRELLANFFAVGSFPLTVLDLHKFASDLRYQQIGVAF
jgi:hypothetical protein